MTASGWQVWGGCEVVVKARGGNLAAAREAVAAVIASFEQAASRFNPRSELYHLNRSPGQPVPVSALLFETVSVALAAAELTGGAVDPTVGAALQRLGYRHTYPSLRGGELPSPPQPTPAGRYREVKLDRRRATVTLPPGTALDLGATAKALAVDRAAEAAYRAAGAPVLVGIGGDLRAFGEGKEGWPVIAAEDHRRPYATPWQRITLRSGGIATSSTTVRRWRAGGQDLHHLIDPRSGKPAASPWRTASVCAATCLQANLLSTAAILWGEAAPERLAAFGVPARLVGRDGTVQPVGPWPKEGR